MQAAPRIPATADLEPRCPLHATSTAAQVFPEPDAELVLPMHRRVLVQTVPTLAGGTELRLNCGSIEVSFDDPGQFAFGQALARQSRFMAREATTWGRGYAWSTVQPLLADLLQAGVLQSAAAEPLPTLLPGPRPAPLPPGTCPTPRLWTEGPALVQELAGRALEPAWLELVLPVFRMAHAALDADGRQVGESNVFPKALRLDVPTQWRACIYPGSRSQAERPMNVTALKAMRQQWPAVLALLAAVRTAYLRRDPQAGQPWTVGRIERLAVAVLGLPTWLLMRSRQPVVNGQLHPALSSLFRVTDGLRMVMHQMLFVPTAEPTRRPDALVTSAEILAYAERNESFHSEHGVCAGPRAMVQEFLAVLLDGSPVAGEPVVLGDPALQDALQAIGPALDYAWLGLQGHAAVFSLWPAMARAYERLAAVSQAWAPRGRPAVQAFAARMAGHTENLRRSTLLGLEAWRAEREAAYADMYAQCHALLAPVGLAGPDDDLRGQIEPLFACTHAVADLRLEALLQARLGQGDGSDRDDVRVLRDAVMSFLLALQAILRVACEAQGRLNRHLGRRAAQRAFDADDLDIHNRLLAAAPTRLPYLIDELQAALSLRIHVDAHTLRIDDAASEALATAGLPPHSAGMVPAEAHAESV